MGCRELKLKLKEAVGLRQSKNNRRVVETLLEDLVKIGDQNFPKEGIQGRWRLVWSSQTAESNPFATPSSVLGGDCFQVFPSDVRFWTLLLDIIL
jgi:hypothetical protein